MYCNWVSCLNVWYCPVVSSLFLYFLPNSFVTVIPALQINIFETKSNIFLLKSLIPLPVVDTILSSIWAQGLAVIVASSSPRARFPVWLPIPVALSFFYTLPIHYCENFPTYRPVDGILQGIRVCHHRDTTRNM